MIMRWVLIVITGLLCLVNTFVFGYFSSLEDSFGILANSTGGWFVSGSGFYSDLVSYYGLLTIFSVLLILSFSIDSFRFRNVLCLLLLILCGYFYYGVISSKHTTLSLFGTDVEKKTFLESLANTIWIDCVGVILISLITATYLLLLISKRFMTGKETL